MAPTKKECVQTLMTFLREEVKEIATRDSEISRKVSYVVYLCPSGDLCRNNSGEVSFIKGTGFTNPFDHLTSCFKSKDEIYSEVRRLRATEVESLGGPSSQEVFADTSTDREQAMFAYLKLIVMSNAPLSCVEDDNYRSFSKFKCQFGRKLVRQVIFSVVEKAEHRIAAEMRSTKGSIIHDSWTFNGCHYVGLFATYIPGQNEKVKVKSPLLSMSLMHSVCKCDDSENCVCDSETIEFDAGTYTEHIKNIFGIYSIVFDEWCISQTADNCNLNHSIASKLNIAHVGCSSHKLNLDIEEMVRRDVQLKQCIESVHKTMSDCKTKIRNRAMLQNISSFTPILECKTRWSGKYLMLKRFTQIYDQLRQVAEDERSTVAMNLTSEFKSDTGRYCKMLRQLDDVTKFLQTDLLPLSDCRLALNTIAEAVDKKKEDSTSDLYNCKLKTRAISPTSRLVTDKAFESGVVKIQRNQVRSLTCTEKHACRRLLLSLTSTAIVSESSDDQEEEKSIMNSISSKRRKLSDEMNKYIDARFICGSVAKVERLWSLAKHILQDHRKSMSPTLVEALLFLKVNWEYWDLSVVCDAINNSPTKRVSDSVEYEEPMPKC